MVSPYKAQICAVRFSDWDSMKVIYLFVTQWKPYIFFVPYDDLFLSHEGHDLFLSHEGHDLFLFHKLNIYAD